MHPERSEISRRTFLTTLLAVAWLATHDVPPVVIPEWQKIELPNPHPDTEHFWLSADHHLGPDYRSDLPSPLALPMLQQFIHNLNRLPFQAAVQLGDLGHDDDHYFGVGLDQFQNLSFPTHHLQGNHDPDWPEIAQQLTERNLPSARYGVQVYRHFQLAYLNPVLDKKIFASVTEAEVVGLRELILQNPHLRVGFFSHYSLFPDEQNALFNDPAKSAFDETSRRLIIDTLGEFIDFYAHGHTHRGGLSQNQQVGFPMIGVPSATQLYSDPQRLKPQHRPEIFRPHHTPGRHLTLTATGDEYIFREWEKDRPINQIVIAR